MATIALFVIANFLIGIVLVLVKRGTGIGVLGWARKSALLDDRVVEGLYLIFGMPVFLITILAAAVAFFWFIIVIVIWLGLLFVSKVGGVLPGAPKGGRVIHK